MAARAIPEGFGTVSAYLVLENSLEAVEFYRKAFDAEAGMHMAGPDGKSTMHMEMRIGDSTLMLSDENPQWGTRSPKTLGGSPVSLHLYVEDADAAFEKAVAAGCVVEYPISDTFWGDRYGKVRDPFGYSWGIATHKQDLTPEQIEANAAEFFESMKG